MVAVDATFFPYLLKRENRAPNDPATGQPIEYLEERIDLLIETLQKEKETIIIPTPALSEFLVLARDDGPAYLKKIKKSPLFKVKTFDEKAAIELAAIRIKTENALSRKKRKKQTPAETKAKISFDRQIVVISKVNDAHTIYTEDDGVAKFAAANKIKVVRVWELEKPKSIQQKLFPKDGKPSAIAASSNVIELAEKRAEIEARDGQEAVSIK